MICQRCKKENPENVKFCIHCGAPMEEKRETPPVFHGDDAEELNDSWSQPEPEDRSTEEKPVTPSKPVKSSHLGVFVALGILIGVIVIGAVVFGVWTVQNNQKHEEQIAQLQEEKEQQEEELEKEKEAWEKAEEEAQEAQQKAQKEDLEEDTEEEIDQYGFETGWYKANYNMVLRASGDYNAARTGSLKKGESIRIVDIVQGASDSYWGKSAEGNWVCLQDPDYHYLSKE